MPMAEKEKSESPNRTYTFWAAVLASIIFTTGYAHCAVIIVSPGESIQEAIDKASSGDTIEVESGTYEESINVNKRLVLSGIGIPVVDANHNTSAIILSEGGCTIKGFKVINSSNCGIYIPSDFNTIVNNTLVDNGICLKNSQRNTIAYNDISASGWWNSGIILESSIYNIIKSNDVSYNGIWGSGITLVDSNYNKLTDNKASGDGWMECKGIFLKYSNTNFISSNTVRGSGWSGCGIYLDSADDNNIKNNNACCSNWGMYIYGSFNNIIEHNIAEDIRLGVFLHLGRYNTIQNNTANIQLIDTGLNTVAGNTGWVYYGTSGP